MSLNLTMIVALLASSCAALMGSRALIHFFQLESYQFPGYLRSIRRNGVQVWVPGFYLFLAHAAAWMLYILLGNGVWQAFLWAALILGSGALISRDLKTIKAKKPLVFTARVKRLCAVVFLVSLGIRICCVCLMTGVRGVPARVFLSCVWMAFPLMLPVLVLLAGMLAAPMEKFIQNLYFRDAQRILRSRPDLIKIGITGSYGKTSVKFILGTLLSEKYQTLVSPASFNTPMGLTKVIRNSLTPSHQVFVAEMGARHVGDIRELCRLVHPEIGLLVSIGPQHLETFGSMERIAGTKYELMDAIPGSGCCFFLDDGGTVTDLYEKTEKPKMLASVKPGTGDVWAENMEVSQNGSTFLLCTRTQRIPCTTRLLGEHNIGNILLAASVCFHLGMTGTQISRGISQLEPVEHRLQLLPTAGGITMIDDAFNSNPRGAHAALQVLKRFPERRIIVTPGMVELGADEEKYNYDFGVEMAACVDLAILVGPKRTKAIQQGLMDGGFEKEKLFVVKSLDEATGVMRSLARRGDTVLFENDLPDNYSE